MSVPGTKYRLFVALPLPDDVRGELAGYLERCARLAPEQRWAPPANLHLTLHFLGWVEPGAMAAVRAELEGVRRPPFEVQIGGLGRFGNGSRTRVLWVDVTAGRDSLGVLAGEVAEACRRAGVVGEERPYNPHLTLCRVRSGTRPPALPELPQLRAWEARGFTLFQSRPGPQGSVYVPLREYRLASLDAPPGDTE